MQSAAEEKSKKAEDRIKQSELIKERLENKQNEQGAPNLKEKASTSVQPDGKGGYIVTSQVRREWRYLDTVNYLRRHDSILRAHGLDPKDYPPQQ